MEVQAHGNQYEDRVIRERTGMGKDEYDAKKERKIDEMTKEAIQAEMLLAAKEENFQKAAKLKKKLDEDRLRPTDITLQIPNTSKFKQHFGWTPRKNLTNICEDLLNYWRGVL